MILIEKKPINFLWLELTNSCNLECIHCYANSGPKEGRSDNMTKNDYMEVLKDAYLQGCRQVQFIGGEATLNRDLADLIEFSSSLRYEFIEVFSNLVSISSKLLSKFIEHNIQVATSLYSYDEQIHDTITTSSGSWKRTIKNLEKMLALNIPCRVGIIEMDVNSHQISETEKFVRNLGVENVKVDNIRGFGRGSRDSDDHEMSSLCGKCSEDVLCVGPDGLVSPCIMSKKWSIGNIHEDSIDKIILSERLENIRKQIDEAVNMNVRMGSCNPDCSPVKCSPARECPPTKCNPAHNCSPTQCYPNR